MHPRLRNWQPLAIGIPVSIYLLITLAKFFPMLLNPYVFTDDAAQHIAPLYTLDQPEVYQDDLLTQYKKAYLPLGFKAIYYPLSRLIDPLLLGKIIALVLIVSTWLLAFLIGKHLGGVSCGWLTALLFAHSEYLSFVMFGGLFRSFAPLLFLFFVLSWIRRNYWAIPIALALQSIFYPPVFLISLCAFGLGMLFEVKAWLFERRKQLVFLGAAVLVSLANLMAFSQKPEHFGEVLSVGDAKNMKEWQKNGRFSDLPFPSPIAQVLDGMEAGLKSTRQGFSVSKKLVEFHRSHGSFMFWIFIIGTGLCAAMNKERPYWWLCIFSAAVVLHLAARITAFKLGWPDRYVLYPLSIITLLLFPLAWQALRQRRPEAPGKITGIGILPVLGVLLFYPFGFTGLKNNKTVNADASAEMIEFVHTLPHDVYFAGWPRKDMDYVYLLGHRKVLVDYESAHPLYLDYYREMATRTKDTMQLYFAPKHEHASVIRDKYGLTHLLLRKGIAQAKLYVPSLYEPMSNYAIRRKEYAIRRGGFYFENPRKEWLVYEDERYQIIDLRKIQ